MIKALQQTTILVPAGALGVPGIAKGYLAGSFFYAKASTAVFKMQFDAQGVFDFEGGFKLQDTGEFATQTFYNYNAFPITINYYVGEIGVDYVGSNEVKVASTFLVGNLNGQGNITPDSSGYITTPKVTISSHGKVTNLSSLLKVPGIYQGHVRKSLILGSRISGSSLVILDSSGYICVEVFTGNPPMIFDCSDTVYIGGKSDDGSVALGEIYYSI